MFPPSTTPTRVTHYNRGYGYGLAGVSGTIAAALGANSIVFGLRCDAQASAHESERLCVFLDKLRLAFTTIVAFTTAISAGRRLGVYRASGDPTTGGTALAVAKKDTIAPASIVSDARIATVGALGVANVVREANPIAVLDLTHAGAAGARMEACYEWAAPKNAPLVIAPGELLVVSNPIAMDAAGTWQLSVDECHWIEAPRTSRLG